MKPIINYSGVNPSYSAGVPVNLAPTNTGGAPEQGTKITNFSGNITPNLNYPVDGSTNQTTYKFPCGVATTPDGTTYVIDEYGPFVRKITPQGVSSIIAGSFNISNPATGEIEMAHVDGKGVNAKFLALKAIAVDLAGNVYVSELGNWQTGVGNYIRKIDAEGNVTTIAGNGTAGSLDSANPLLASFKNIEGLSVGFDGTIYVADTGNHRIRKIAPNGAVTTVAGSTAGNAVGNVSVAKFRSPKAVVSDDKGNLFVADTDNGQLKKIDSSGNVTNIPVVTPYFSLSSPAGLVYTGGNLYISDDRQHVLFKVDTLSQCTIYAGNGVSKFRDGNCNYTTFGASLYAPGYLSSDGKGTVVVADRNNFKIRKVETAPAFTIIPALPQGLVLNPLTGVISGTPSKTTLATTYTITASNYEGYSNATIRFAVS